MTTLRGAGTVLVATVLKLIPLLLLDGDRRAMGFRAGTLLLGLLALRAISRFNAEANAPPTDSPFTSARRIPGRLRRRRPTPARAPLDALVLGAIERSGQFHFRLRPLLREVADERLRARHGLGIDDPAAEAVLGQPAFDHLRPDRAAPDDRRAPGPDLATLRAVFDALERI
jgi:hypothetical protein